MTRQVAISDVAQINPRPPARLKRAPETRVFFVPMSAVSEDGRLQGTEVRTAGQVLSGHTYFERGDILLAKITPCFENGKAALLEQTPCEVGFGSTEFHVLRSGPEVDARYLFFSIWNPLFRAAATERMTGSAGQRRVPTDFLGNYRLPLPGLPAQRRIAAVLEKADAIRRKRQQALELADDLLRVTFLEVVGPGHPDYPRWPVCTIEQLAAKHAGAIRTGPFGSDLRHSEFVESGIAVLGIDNAVRNRFEWAQRRFITEETFHKLQRYRVFPSDVVVTIMGTTGRSAVVPEDIPAAISTKHLATITPDSSLAEPEFLSNAIHRHPAILRQIRGADRGAIMPGLNLTILKGLKVPLPPLRQQTRFSSLVASTRILQSNLAADLHAANDLMAALVQRAFRGGLHLSEPGDVGECR